jgi:hypothetical protein
LSWPIVLITLILLFRDTALQHTPEYPNTVAMFFASRSFSFTPEGQGQQ